VNGPASPQLAIVVVSYGSSALLAENLASIDRASLPPSLVVVVNNATDPTEARAVEALAREHAWELIAPGANLGFGGGMNVGAARALAAGCSQLLLLNPDVAIDASSIVALAEQAAEGPLTLASPRLDWPDGRTWYAGSRIDLRTGFTQLRPDHEQTGSDRWLAGTCLLVDRRAWELVGGFDERYFLYWEDVELTHRALGLGVRLLVVHDVVAVHSVGATQRQEGKSATYCRYNCRNRLLFATDHVGRRERLRWLWNAPRYAGRVLVRHGPRQALRRPALVLAAAYGTIEGALMVGGSLVRRGPS
jgi:N-acetylglucosaminyl-diphospho-decaprenol L-rhamnosyltransferase